MSKYFYNSSKFWNLWKWVLNNKLTNNREDAVIHDQSIKKFYNIKEVTTMYFDFNLQTKKGQRVGNISYLASRLLEIKELIFYANN